MPLEDYALSDFTHAPWTRQVYRRGSGPAVIIIHEIPGLHPQVVEFADRVVEAGMTVFMPSCSGRRASRCRRAMRCSKCS